MVDNKPVGWRREPVRHSLAAKGIKTKVRGISDRPLPKNPDRPLTQKEQAFLADVEVEVLQRLYPSEYSDMIGRLGRMIEFASKKRNYPDVHPDDADELKAAAELEWILVQLHDDPQRLLKEKWGFKPKGGR